MADDTRRTVLITGAGGQLGHELMRLPWPGGLVPLGGDRDVLDITDAASIAATMARITPAAVVNAAAYTAVDKAESEPEAARAANADGPRLLAEACAVAGIPLVHVSTDYVFDGSKNGAYTEADPVAPLGVYGITKEAGEAAVRAALPAHVILRTAWVFGAHGHNFVKTMLRLAAERDELRVVADQHGCPTGAADIAGAIIAMLRQIVVEGRRDAFGTYHFSGAGPTTWHGFAEAIVARQAAKTGKRPPVRAIATAEFPTPARRPANSVLDCGLIGHTFGITPRPWPHMLDDVLAEIL